MYLFRMTRRNGQYAAEEGAAGGGREGRNRTAFACATAILAAVSALLMTLEFPCPWAAFLRYDLSDVPALFAGFSMGWKSGFAVVLLRNLIRSLLMPAEMVGLLMNTLASGTFVVVSAAWYERKRTKRGALEALAWGTLLCSVVMVLANLVVLPIYLGLSVEAAGTLVLTSVLPFNLTRALLVSVAAFLFYKRVSPLLPHLHDLPGGKEGSG